MNPYKFFFALIAFFGFVMVVPPWMWVLDNWAGPLSTEGYFMATLVLPAAVVLYLASWLQPRGA